MHAVCTHMNILFVLAVQLPKASNYSSKTLSAVRPPTNLGGHIHMEVAHVMHLMDWLCLGVVLGVGCVQAVLQTTENVTSEQT